MELVYVFYGVKKQVKTPQRIFICPSALKTVGLIIRVVYLGSR